MKKRELYEERVWMDAQYSFQLSKDAPEYVNIYRDDALLESFKLNRKIYTFFKVLQDYTHEGDSITVLDNQIEIYGKEIYLYDDVYMKINADRACLTLDFYQKGMEQDTKLIYLTKLIYTTQKLFYMMLIPKKLKEKPSYYITNVFKFLDMIELTQMVKSE